VVHPRPRYRPLAFSLPSQRTAFSMNLQGNLFLVDRKRFMSGPEVENFAFAQVPDTPAAEPIAGLPAFLKHHVVGIGNVKRLAVHLGRVNFKLLGDALGNGMFPA